MGFVAFAGEDESQPSNCNGKSCKLPTTILGGCGAVSHASIPRKLRSAIKKRGRESVTSPLLISRKQHHALTRVDKLRKDGAKKSKLNNKQQGHITKDEEEVAETLYALAGMFSDANKADQQTMDDEKPEIKTSATLEEGISINVAEDTCPMLQQETRKISSDLLLGAVYPSNLVNPTAQEVISQTLEARQPELFSSKQATTPNASGDQSDLFLDSTSRPLVSIRGMNQSCEQEMHLDQVGASGFHYRKNYLFLSPNLSATRAMSSETHKSCPRSSSTRSCLFEATTFSPQPRVIENKIISTKKYTRVATESNRSWKRCSAHVYISRLIKVLQISDRSSEGLPVKPTHPTTCGGAELQSHLSTHNQTLRINGRNGDAYLSATDTVAAANNESSQIQNGILPHKRPIRDQQMAFAKQEYDFLSLGTRDDGKSANGAECFLEPPKQKYHMPYMQSQNHSLLQNGYSSSLHSHNSASAAQQVQLSQYHSGIGNSNYTARPTTGHYNIDSSSASHVLNYAHSLFPHLHAAAALGSKYQHLPPSQHQLMLMNTSLPLSNFKTRHNLPLGVERSGAMFNPQNMAQLQQLPCNHHL